MCVGGAPLLKLKVSKPTVEVEGFKSFIQEAREVGNPQKLLNTKKVEYRKEGQFRKKRLQDVKKY